MVSQNFIMITVLKSTRGILRLTGLGTDSLIVFKKLKIPNRVIQIVIVFSQIYATLPYILYTSGNSYLLERIDNPAYAIVGMKCKEERKKEPHLQIRYAKHCV